MMHQAFDDSDQTRKYGTSESIIQALIMTLFALFTFSFGHYHQVPGASCSILYILVLSLVIFMQSLYPFLIYEIFHLLVYIYIYIP